nr:response regulator [Pyrinomonadaceae bacterium]
GSYRYLESNAAPVLNVDGELTGYRGTDRDVTDRIRAQQALIEKEEQLRQAQKMEAIGQLAGGVAHDFNNLLTAILGYSELLLRELPPDAAPSRHKVEEIKHAGERAATLTRQLLAFSRKQMLQPKVLNPNVVALGVEKMLRRLLGEHLELRLKLEPAVGLIKADPGQLEQVVINLSINARDAMPEGGKLLVETRNVELDEHYAGRRADVVRPGRYVMLAVSDTGTGIEPQIQERIFDPFFTTKEQGKGTGLGLSTVYGIVKQSEGHLWVYSEPGRGTTFKVYLPRVDEPADLAAAGATTVPAAAVPGGAETVLLVEDEEIVRELTREMLELIGYRVVAAADGAEALEIARRQPANWPGLLLTDVVMTRMSGRELSGRLRAFHPQVKTLFMSGYTEAAIVQHGVIDSDIAFLPKPFTLDDLARKLREVIDAPDKNTLGNQ